MGKSMINGNSFDTFDELSTLILKLIRDAGLCDTQLLAIEPDAEMNPLLHENGYNEVVNRGAEHLYETPNAIFDFVILGDVLEHFKYSDGLDLLQYLNYRAAYILIITPEAIPLRAPEFMVGHNAQWPPRLMMWHDYWLYQRCGQMHFYLLRGILSGGNIALHEVMAQVNAENISLSMPIDNDKKAHQECPVQLQMIDQRTHDIATDGNMAYYYRPA